MPAIVAAASGRLATLVGAIRGVPVIRISVIVPFHRNLALLRRVLAPFATRPAHVELIVAADGPIEDWRPVAAEFGASGVELPVRSGPAAARNRGAAIAQGEILVFVDGDVIAAADAVSRIEAVLDAAGVKDLVVCGAMSHMCVDAATRAASDFGYKVTLAHDACATRDAEFNGVNVPAAQVHASFMSALGSYAKVLSTADVITSTLKKS